MSIECIHERMNVLVILLTICIIINILMPIDKLAFGKGYLTPTSGELEKIVFNLTCPDYIYVYFLSITSKNKSS